MKFDLHCHTKEGSLDSGVAVTEFADQFTEAGYDGFMIADHNSYRGCRAWDEIKGDPRYENLTVIRGIEYDTKDAGHVLIIMPDDIYLSIFRIRGMRCAKVIRLVHAFRGIIGLAHPFGAAGSSAMGFKKWNMKLMRHMDFVEVFNTCEFPQSNKLARELADKYGLPGVAGSDSHVPDYIGMAVTEIQADIRCNNDLIAAIRQQVPITASGTERQETKKARRKEHWIGVLGYKAYNRGIAKLVCPYRKYRHRKLRRNHIHYHI